jgi:hypothetical protein
MATAKGARTGAVWGAQFIKDTEPRVLNELDQGYESARGTLAQATQAFNPYASRFGSGSAMFSDALGLGGQAGTQRAQSAFEAGPGFDFQMDQGMQAINRRRAAGGMLNSGNADTDAMQFGQGLARQSWNDWLQNLSTMDQRGLQTAGSQAGLAGSLGALATDYYGKRAGVIGDNLNNIIGLNVGALKAGDQARAQNNALVAGGINSALGLLGAATGGGLGGGGGAAAAGGGGAAAAGGSGGIGGLFRNIFGFGS